MPIPPLHSVFISQLHLPRQHRQNSVFLLSASYYNSVYIWVSDLHGWLYWQRGKPSLYKSVCSRHFTWSGIAARLRIVSVCVCLCVHVLHSNHIISPSNSGIGDTWQSHNTATVGVMFLLLCTVPYGPFIIKRRPCYRATNGTVGGSIPGSSCPYLSECFSDWTANCSWCVCLHTGENKLTCSCLAGNVYHAHPIIV